MKRWLVGLVCFILLAGLTESAAAQGEPPEDPDLNHGIRLYQERCATCHGPFGLGDGELAENLPNPPLPIGSPAYLADADPAAMFQIVQNGNLAQGMPGFGVGNNSNPLSAADIWDILAGLNQLEQLSRPLPEATIAGQLAHAENLPLPDGLTITLQAFDPQAQSVEALRLETEAAADGRYRFDLTQIPPGWIFRTAVNYQQIDFTSQLISLDPLAPQVDLPITIFETTTVADALRINALTFLVEFVEDRVQIAELYAFENRGLTVYTGSTGDPDAGTLFFPLDLSTVESPTALRSLDGGATLLPLELIEKEAGGVWAAVPVGPGPDALTIVLRYELPASEFLNGGPGIVRPLNYPAARVELFLPDVGVELPETSWRVGEGVDGDVFGDGLPRRRFEYLDLDPSNTVVLTLNGWPDRVVDQNGNVLVNRNPTRELLWGGGALAVVLAFAVALAWRWRTTPPPVADRDDLLRRLAALDEAFAEGELPRTAYRRRRARLVASLRDIWPT